MSGLRKAGFGRVFIDPPILESASDDEEISILSSGTDDPEEPGTVVNSSEYLRTMGRVGAYFGEDMVSAMNKDVEELFQFAWAGKNLLPRLPLVKSRGVKYAAYTNTLVEQCNELFKNFLPGGETPFPLPGLSHLKTGNFQFSSGNYGYVFWKGHRPTVVTKVTKLLGRNNSDISGLVERSEASGAVDPALIQRLLNFLGFEKVLGGTMAMILADKELRRHFVRVWDIRPGFCLGTHEMGFVYKMERVVGISIGKLVGDNYEHFLNFVNSVRVTDTLDDIRAKSIQITDRPLRLLIRRVARLTGIMNARGIYHNDLHGENIIVFKHNENQRHWHFKIIDYDKICSVVPDCVERNGCLDHECVFASEGDVRQNNTAHFIEKLRSVVVSKIKGAGG